jgi:hypothetical protein
MNSDGQFTQAIQALQNKGLLPTDLSSAQLRQISAAIRRQSIFSARTSMENYLGKIKEVIGSIIEPKQVTREGREQTVTEGLNDATARQELRRTLDMLGYSPTDEEAGTIKDLASDGRLQLVVRTNTQLAQGAGAFVRQNFAPEVVEEYPALELVRFEDREHPRRWTGAEAGEDAVLGGNFGSRWDQAARIAGDPEAARILEETGRMIALKSSGIWQALGDFEDGLGNPFPPFAFNSGMWTEDISRKDAGEFGLLDEGEEAKPADFDLSELFSGAKA